MSAGRVVSGLHSVRTALRHGTGAVEEVWVEARRRDGRIGEIRRLARAAGVPVREVPREELDHLAEGANHQGVAARSRVAAALDEGALKEILANAGASPLLLVLDEVQDPHNLGACLRTADAAGVAAVVTPRNRAVGLTATVCKIASGAVESVPFVQVTNLARALRWLREVQGLRLVGAVGEAGSSVYDADLKGPLAIVMGAEDRGLRRLTREQCEALVSIPMAGLVESLNVSVATGIILYEAVRQRGALPERSARVAGPPTPGA